MGILNATPDSFYSGSRVESIQSAVDLASQMLDEGADILDIGGQSTRPGAENIAIEEELDRVIPAIQAILSRFPEAIISIDTFNSTVTRQAVEAGAAIVNDISGGQFDDQMFETVGALDVPYVLTHTLGRSDKMQDDPQYDDVVLEVAAYLSERVALLRKLGVKDIILDPGFGFGKTVRHNYELLNCMAELTGTDLPFLAGISRKSMIFKPLNSNALESLSATIALNSIALDRGASILRVHDVKEAVQVVKMHSFVSDPASL